MKAYIWVNLSDAEVKHINLLYFRVSYWLENTPDGEKIKSIPQKTLLKRLLLEPLQYINCDKELSPFICAYKTPGGVVFSYLSSRGEVLKMLHHMSKNSNEILLDNKAVFEYQKIVGNQ